MQYTEIHDLPYQYNVPLST